MKKVIVFVMMLGFICFSGCAAGSATAIYSVRAKTAEELSPEAEQRLVDRIMRDVKLWHEANK
ncbi:hypothetical protein LCGC14_2000520 [marine sediment metagenome]|uniref:Uncharacterized protein n=1 Tax=marine sediment metagenome TaxID=412755 RepID=A0A0F9I0H2_9ZZZZ